MKTVKVMCAATLLALSLSITAYADGGEAQSPGKTTPVTSGNPSTIPGGTSTDIPAEGGELNLSAFAGIVWALASIL